MSSSSSKSRPQWIYDVFINFRGGGTRNFVSHLYYALLNAGVNTFFDEENLLKGMQLEELMRAIEGSQIAIVVFSETYTESTWCLTELEKIIECHETCGQLVVPIFYDVDPSVVRHPIGHFENALKAAAEKKHLPELLEYGLRRWRTALTKAANFSGWDVRNRRNKAKLVKEIVEDVLTKLDYALLSITEFPVGLEPRMQQVIGFIENQSTKVSIIGIWGMGGSGKTTIAKAIYNQIHRRFMDKSFIENIREVCETDGRGHVILQEQLLSDVLKTKVKIHSVGMGKTMIENRLSGKRALIVLDDVNEFGQLKDLCGNRKWFGQGSVILITTRDLHLLDLLKVDYVYEMDKMDEDESLELFSWHAFREAKPVEDFNELARNVVAYCGGLPLALEVLGSYLIERTKKDWESVLSKLKIIPNDQVQEKLRISFDGLRDHMEKDIFLDICCFFIGKDRAYVTEILNGCGLHADIGITVLIERSLLKVERNNKLGMHQLLRDMGREIICESSRTEPGKRSRLWFHEDVLDVLAKNTGTEAIEGLALKFHFTGRDCFKAYAFEEMKRLRLLQLDHVLLTGDYGYLSKKLRWICWQGFPSKYIPNKFYLEGVIAIDLKHSNLRLVWKEPQVLPWLKFLNLSHSKYLTETPDFLKLPSLEKLILKDCPSLCKVHKSIGDLRNLLLINLKDCTSLGNLPREIYKLKSVKTLILSGCLKIDKLEEDIVQMESLTTLFAENTAVKQVPFSIVSSKSIGYISLCGYEGLSRNVFPSIIRSWMSPTMNPLSYFRPFCTTSSYLVSMDMQSDNLGDLGPMLSNLSNLRSVLVQCDTEFQLSKQVQTILNDVFGVNFTELEITSRTSQISKQYLRSYLIGIGSYDQEVFNTLSNSISEGLAANEGFDVFLSGGNDPSWLTNIGEGHAVYFTVPEGCCMKGMTLCVVYSSSPETTEPEECLISVIMVNYTKCTIQIHKRDTVISFNDVDWQGIISHLGPGDKVEIFVIFGHELVVKKTVVYLIYGESIDLEMDPSPKPKKETKKKAIGRFIKKIVTSKTQEQ
ncbi:TMV resistance protein N isoform X1 [Cajanus cajan]|uniref:TMV resistance protein N isoform X1 n=1 Tax=Cajanus cajan TaxID=3821 RepID=UPI00098DA1B9|nr:TMV resistance protein N isoform X1 [Cajanus cajan]